MLSHSQIWMAIDRLAEQCQLSSSGLARRAGLDPTTFNKSKRIGPDGRKRWPSTESLAKILDAADTSLDDFFDLTNERKQEPPQIRVPLIGFAQAGGGGYFDDGGFPLGGGWEEVDFPDIRDENAYALEITGDSMLPVYRDGDIIIVSPAGGVRRGDRVVAKTTKGEVMAKLLARKTATMVVLASFNPEHEDRVFELDEIDWIARIVWASQ
ncbi:MAG: DNA-binding protein [Hyphomicrobiales bacterium]|nr:MAG: DNA-binding protein [Hyphomicrobiales bacterium]